MSRTYSQKNTEVTRTWYILDASTMPYGRLSTQAASLLIGKHKPSYTPHVDGGDYVIIINAAKLVFSGNNKASNKRYYRHSGYPGGIRSKTLEQKLEEDPCDVIVHAVRGMIPANKLRDGRLARLKVYVDDQHNHSAQKPVQFNSNGDSK